MQVNPYIFRAYDIRGIYRKDIDENLFRKIGFVLGRPKKKFVVGNDIRKSGKKLAKGLIEGLTKRKAKVIYAGTGSFGQILFSGLKLNAFQTLFITASHLPPEWNGLKIYFGDGEPLPKEGLDSLREKVLEIGDKKISFPKIQQKKVNLKKDYIKDLLHKFPLIKNNKLKVILDCGNGSLSLVAPEVFKKFGFKVSKLFCKANPSFPNRSPEPTFDATEILRKRVKKEKADFGVAFDGDGDRAVIIDDKGKYLSGNQIGVILGKEILSASKRKIVIKTVACSITVEEELKKLGAKIIEVPVGHTYVISGCKRKKGAIGIEESGHIVMPKYYLFDDAILIPLKIAEILIKKRKKLSQIVEKIKIYPFESLVFKCQDQIKFKVVKKLTKKFKKRYKKINTTDGIKVNFEDSWILIRASNTSPKIRLYIEAKTKERLSFLKEKFSQILKKEIFA